MSIRLRDYRLFTIHWKMSVPEMIPSSPGSGEMGRTGNMIPITGKSNVVATSSELAQTFLIIQNRMAVDFEIVDVDVDIIDGILLAYTH